MTLTRFRKGALSVPRLYTPILDTLVGNMNIRRQGANRFILANAYISVATVDLVLPVGKRLEDSGLNLIIGSDGSGHIDQLARIDCNIAVNACVTVDGVDLSVHDADADAHHVAYADADALAAVDEHIALESANATWINCPFEGASEITTDEMDYKGAIVPAAIVTGARYIFAVPLSTTRGGKSLFINGTRVSLASADGNDRVTATAIYGMGDSTATSIDSDATSKETTALHQDVSMGNLDVSAYNGVKVILNTATNGIGDLEIQYVSVRYYYA